MIVWAHISQYSPLATNMLSLSLETAMIKIEELITDKDFEMLSSSYAL